MYYGAGLPSALSFNNLACAPLVFGPSGGGTVAAGAGDAEEAASEAVPLLPEEQQPKVEWRRGRGTRHICAIRKGSYCQKGVIAVLYAMRVPYCQEAPPRTSRTVSPLLSPSTMHASG